MNFKRISAPFAALLAVGCGTNPSFTTLTNNSNSFQAYADGTGRYRTFSFDYARAEKQNARQVYPNLPIRRELPGKVDLRATCSEIGDQGKLGSCTAWAMGDGLREFLVNKSGAKLTQLSPLFFYYKEREIMGTIDEDSGATITDGMTVLKQTGIAPEADWPYVIEKFNIAPPAVAEENAAQFKVSKTIPIRGLDQVKNQLASGYPVAFGFRVYKSFMGKDVAATGIMPMPKPGEQMMGGHAVLAVGYDDEKKVLIVRNSWGTKWGDKGYFYMPYDNMKWSMDFWTAQ